MTVSKPPRLTTTYKEEVERINKKMVETEIECKRVLKELVLNKNKLVRKWQEECVHDEVTVTTDFDYHRREYWDTHTCAECGKFLKRV